MGLLAFCVCSEVIVMGKYWTGLSECQKIWWVQAYVVGIISLPLDLNRVTNLKKKMGRTSPYALIPKPHTLRWPI